MSSCCASRCIAQARVQPSTCHEFGAMGYGGYWGNVSGTVGLSCARHMCVLPCGGVDLQKGERCVAPSKLTPHLTMSIGS